MSRRTVHVDPAYGRQAYTGRGKETQPLRGNQLAQALSKVKLAEATPLDETSAPVDQATPIDTTSEAEPTVGEPAPLFQTKAIDREQVVADVHAWLVRLLVEERVPVPQMTQAMSSHLRTALVRKFAAAGLVTVHYGPRGGVRATPELRRVAQEAAISDWDLKRFIWPGEYGMSPEETAEAMERFPSQPEEPEAEITATIHKDEIDITPEPQEYEPPLFTSEATTPIVRQSRVLQEVRAWLLAIADGKHAKLGQLTTHANAYTVAARLREAGLIEKHEHIGARKAVWYEIPGPMVEYVRALTDEQLSDLIWGRAALPTVSPVAPATMPADAPPEPDSPVEIIATRLTQIVNVLVRLDKRLARLERELGLPAIEEDKR